MPKTSYSDLLKKKNELAEENRELKKELSILNEVKNSTKSVCHDSEDSRVFISNSVSSINEAVFIARSFIDKCCRHKVGRLCESWGCWQILQSIKPLEDLLVSEAANKYLSAVSEELSSSKLNLDMAGTDNNK